MKTIGKENVDTELRKTMEKQKIEGEWRKKKVKKEKGEVERKAKE